MPQAAGAAYAIKLDENRQGDCVICYFGDGESDSDAVGLGVESPWYADTLQVLPVRETSMPRWG